MSYFLFVQLRFSFFPCHPGEALEGAASKFAEGKSMHIHKRVALIAAASQLHSRGWLNAIPVGRIGNRLDKDFQLIGVAIRHGLHCSQPYMCHYSSMIYADGLHPLSCRYNTGRHSRLSAMNDINNRSFNEARTGAELQLVQ